MCLLRLWVIVLKKQITLIHIRTEPRAHRAAPRLMGRIVWGRGYFTLTTTIDLAGRLSFRMFFLSLAPLKSMGFTTSVCSKSL